MILRSPALVNRYERRFSGPLLGRIDIHVEVPRGKCYTDAMSETRIDFDSAQKGALDRSQRA